MYLIGGLLLSSVMLFAQSGYKKATDAEKKEIIDKITQASASMKSMKCDFTQIKELSFMDDRVTSEGKMLFKSPDKIRWEYTRPYSYIFSMDGTHVRMSSGDNTKVPVKSSKLFNEISKVLIGGVSGTGLIDSPDFSTLFNTGKDSYQVVLTPQKKEVKALFSSIRLYVGKADSRIHTVELIEKSGDKTTIELKNVQLNATIQDDIFAR
jgi:outer membrane lipoprotein-sorting protein